MKAKLFAIALFLFALAACTQHDAGSVETRHGKSLPTAVSSELSSIDSLMWHHPDSALMMLLPFFDTCRDVECYVYLENNNGNLEDLTGHVSTAMSYNRHYAHLLLAELLYKNDCALTNRTELQQAVAYFDSLVGLHEADARRVSAKNATPTNVFLDARAHYINGVGYYENDSLVPACAEYLKALELMENRFEQKDLVGEKAKFMTYTYNRLGDMFSEQFMMEPAIDCYNHSYDYSLISPISSFSVSNALYRIGKQYNKKGDKDSADYYYSQALEYIPDSTNLNYRDIASTKALLSYQLTHQAETPLRHLKQLVILAEDDDERLTRYLVIGGIFFEENLYDSALLYLEPMMENKGNKFLKIQVANYLRIIYDSLGNKDKSNECIRYLALHNETGAENSALVSQLSGLYKAYLSQKQEKEAGTKREAAVKKAIEIIVPIAAALALAIIVVAKWRSKKLLKQQQEEADRRLGETEQQHKEELKRRQAETEKTLEERDKRHAEAIETERQIHRMEQAALSGRLKRSNQEIRELKDQIKQLDDLAAKTKVAASFEEEPVCRLIMERVHDGQFKSKIDYFTYKDAALDKQQLLDLRMAADHHFRNFTVRLKKAYPELTNSDLDYCCLYLLGLTDADIAALMQRTYNTVFERNGKIRKIIGSENPLPITLKGMANDSLLI